jgi:hypothetical protein
MKRESSEVGIAAPDDPYHGFFGSSLGVVGGVTGGAAVGVGFISAFISGPLLGAAAPGAVFGAPASGAGSSVLQPDTNASEKAAVATSDSAVVPNLFATNTLLE